MRAPSARPDAPTSPLAAPLRALAAAAAAVLERLSPNKAQRSLSGNSWVEEADPARPCTGRAGSASADGGSVRAPPCHALPLPPTDKLTVVLDLDETLIAAYPEPAPRVPLGRRRASPTVVVRDVDLGDGASGPVRVFLRPGLATFLDEVAAFADVVLFTAGLSGYAAPLLAALDPTGARLPVRLYRPSTRTIAGTPCVKDLSVLGRDLARVVLVDNSPFSFLAQPACGVPAAPFDGCGDDAHLLDAVLPLLRSLASVDDVRPALAARFGMAAWLAARGGWALYEAPCGNLALAGETGGGAVPAAA